MIKSIFLCSVLSFGGFLQATPVHAASATEYKFSRFANAVGDRAEYLPRVNIVNSVQTPAAGVLSSGTIFQGVNPGDQSGMHWHAYAGSSGTNPDSTSVATDILTVAWTPRSFSHFGTTSYASAALQDFISPVLSFSTNAAIFGIAGGVGNSPLVLRVWVDLLDGNGYKQMNPVRPWPNTNGLGSIVYFSFAAGDSSANKTKNVLVLVNGDCQGLAIPSSASLSLVDFSKQALVWSGMGDSIGSTTTDVALKIYAVSSIFSGAGGTGYAQPLNENTRGSQTSTTPYVVSGVTTGSSTTVTINSGLGSNPIAVSDVVTVTAVVGISGLNGVTSTVSAIGGSSGAWTFTVPVTTTGSYSSGGCVDPTDVTRSTISGSGNIGSVCNGVAMLTAASPTAKTDAIINAAPEVVDIAYGINDPTQAIFSNGNQFNFESSIDTVLQRLRTGLPNAILIVHTPWTGQGRGATGLLGGAYTNHDDVDKATSVKNRLALIAGPWLFVSGNDSTWNGKRLDGSTFSGNTGTSVWVRGSAYVANPTNDTIPPNSQSGNDSNSNAGNTVNDGTHPSDFWSATLTSSATVSASFTIAVSDSGGAPYSGSFSVQPAGGPASNYANEVVVNCSSKSIGSKTVNGCTSSASNGTVLANGSNIYVKSTTIPDGTFSHGYDYRETKMSQAISAAAKNFAPNGSIAGTNSGVPLGTGNGILGW